MLPRQAGIQMLHLIGAEMAEIETLKIRGDGSSFEGFFSKSDIRQLHCHFLHFPPRKTLNY